jgi:leucine dehydrogenase
VDALNVETCFPEEIFGLDVDVFAPCALGAILNRDTINRLKAKIVAGSANNQLAHHHYASLLQERGILYAPDFLINSGGLIQVAVLYGKGTLQDILARIDEISSTLFDIFERAEREKRSTSDIAEQIAKERLK